MFGFEYFVYQTSNKETLPIMCIVFVNAALYCGWGIAVATNSSRPVADKKA